MGGFYSMSLLHKFSIYPLLPSLGWLGLCAVFLSSDLCLVLARVVLFNSFKISVVYLEFHIIWFIINTFTDLILYIFYRSD